MGKLIGTIRAHWFEKTLTQRYFLLNRNLSKVGGLRWQPGHFRRVFLGILSTMGIIYSLKLQVLKLEG